LGAAENLATHARWAEADDRHDLSHHHEFIHPDIEVHHLDGETVVGLEALIKNMEDSIAAMPDYHVEIDDRFATENRVLCRWRVMGNPIDSVTGGPADGPPIEVAGISVWEFVDGRARRGWVCSNAAFLMQQGVGGAGNYSIHAHKAGESSGGTEK
jgi:predicted ester cyclase